MSPNSNLKLAASKETSKVWPIDYGHLLPSEVFAYRWYAYATDRDARFTLC